MFGLGVIPSGLFLVGAWFLPESPRWLLRNNLEVRAEIVLSKIGDSVFVSESITMIKGSLWGVANINYAALLKRAMLPAVLTGIGLAVFQQFCGINTVFNYAPKIFQSIGASQDDQLLQTVFIGSVNLVFTVLAMLLVDKLGRKPLMLIGAGGLAIMYVFIVSALHANAGVVSVLLLAAIGTYAMTLAPVIWVLIAEIFPSKIRSAAITVAVVSLWLAYFILVFTFPVLFEYLKENTFYIYACVCASGFFFVLFRIRETKGKTLEEAEQAMIMH
jgi:sugar porter (SP) family MFS transporter